MLTDGFSLVDAEFQEVKLVRSRMLDIVATANTARLNRQQILSCSDKFFMGLYQCQRVCLE
jgi:hypothetical protein